MIRVIPHRVQYDPLTGRTASVYGSLLSPRATIETRGWTWEHTDHNGRVTVGLGRAPVQDRDEAERIARSFNASVS